MKETSINSKWFENGVLSLDAIDSFKKNQLSSEEMLTFEQLIANNVLYQAAVDAYDPSFRMDIQLISTGVNKSIRSSWSGLKYLLISVVLIGSIGASFMIGKEEDAEVIENRVIPYVKIDESNLTLNVQKNNQKEEKSISEIQTIVSVKKKISSDEVIPLKLNKELDVLNEGLEESGESIESVKLSDEELEIERKKEEAFQKKIAAVMAQINASNQTNQIETRSVLQVTKVVVIRKNTEADENNFSTTRKNKDVRNHNLGSKSTKLRKTANVSPDGIPRYDGGTTRFCEDLKNQLGNIQLSSPIELSNQNNIVQLSFLLGNKGNVEWIAYDRKDVRKEIQFKIEETLQHMEAWLPGKKTGKKGRMIYHLTIAFK